jgi:CspA family cold shock protein
MRHTGVVNWFDERKGFGFITGEDGQDVFVHYSEIVRDGFQTLAQGELVSFELAQGVESRKACNVVPQVSASML